MQNPLCARTAFVRPKKATECFDWSAGKLLSTEEAKSGVFLESNRSLSPLRNQPDVPTKVEEP